jgi:hypothetical protein
VLLATLEQVSLELSSVFPCNNHSTIASYNFTGPETSDSLDQGKGIGRVADKSLASPTCSTTKRIFLGWVKEVRTTKS